ncbi:hypothetical protein [Ferrimonas balearica]|uniref:hypothetical protein n=1 Tax=Ferrimonas balearica TaxID=44012 RepID=UPI001F17C9C8|nr:hypothetical protein [Ferrimonas balearica]MBY6018824.1 hypothetical protein [Halomonas denitrificans]MBY6096014.1 hypothetical protein [Ferrimonas balearica]
MTERLSPKWLWALLPLILIPLLAVHFWPRGDNTWLLNCHNELYDTTRSDQLQHYMIADFVLYGSAARIYYRYFTTEGKPVANIIMQGKRLSREDDHFPLAMSTVKHERLGPPDALPAHFNQLVNFSDRNLAIDGVHNTSIEVLQHDPDSQSMVVRFLPSQAVCSCVYSR